MAIVTRLSAQEAAELLHEPEVGLLQRAWRVLGADRAEALVNEVLQIEANGGMPRHNGKGRRTPGGVFFELVKQRSSGRQRYAIFQYATAPSRHHRSTRAAGVMSRRPWYSCTHSRKERLP